MLTFSTRVRESGVTAEVNLKPVMRVNTKTGRIQMSDVVISALGLESNAFNTAKDDTGKSFLYINNEAGFKVNPDTRVFTSQLLARTLALDLGVKDAEKFDVFVDLAGTVVDGTKLWEVASSDIWSEGTVTAEGHDAGEAEQNVEEVTQSF